MLQDAVQRYNNVMSNDVDEDDDDDDSLGLLVKHRLQ